MRSEELNDICFLKDKLTIELQSVFLWWIYCVDIGPEKEAANRKIENLLKFYFSHIELNSTNKDFQLLSFWFKELPI